MYRYLTASYVDALDLPIQYVRYSGGALGGWGPRRTMIHGFVTHEDHVYLREPDGLAFTRDDGWSSDGRGGFLRFGA
jgi:hypothetical protein